MRYPGDPIQVEQEFKRRPGGEEGFIVQIKEPYPRSPQELKRQPQDCLHSFWSPTGHHISFLTEKENRE